MIDASSGGALMNKTLEEAWELIETVADANQHFNGRATSKGVYEVALFDSTVLAKSLVDIASMLKEIREGHVNPTACSRNRLSIVGFVLAIPTIRMCPQLQEDNTVASTDNFYDATTILPYNKQYYTQGGRDGQPARWNPPQQPQAQPRQPLA
ncbi:hypothetical protein PIB30_060886 [Stylosanthes scabra]|uniref:Uncharacterized protein n=1 Tax=Stylosanthes scabra TaxID=79078 RepID=A0ABU6TMW1_9FABA|nr:hypothetical protein [Stylosanthes scabra]